MRSLEVGPFWRSWMGYPKSGFEAPLKLPWAAVQLFKRGFWDGATVATGFFGLQPGKQGLQRFEVLILRA